MGEVAIPGIKPPIWVYLLPAALSAGAVLHWPYIYYQVLRIVVCAGAGWIAVHKARTQAMVQAIIAAGIAILFNPVLPVHLSREAHAPINMVTAGLLISMALLEMRRDAARG
ncbi:MAG: hypothetical protein RIS94_2502 [Pseudomonadota bacterium]